MRENNYNKNTDELVNNYVQKASEYEKDFRIDDAFQTLEEAKSFYYGAIKHNSDFLIYYGQFLLKYKSEDNEKVFNKSLKYFAQAIKVKKNYETCITIARILVEENQILEASVYYELAYNRAANENIIDAHLLLKEYGDVCYEFACSRAIEDIYKYQLCFQACKAYSRFIKMEQDSFDKKTINGRIISMDEFLSSDSAKICLGNLILRDFTELMKLEKDRFLSEKAKKLLDNLHYDMEYLINCKFFTKDIVDLCLKGVKSSNPDIRDFAKNISMKFIIEYGIRNPEKSYSNAVQYLREKIQIGDSNQIVLPVSNFFYKYDSKVQQSSNSR